MDFLKKLWLSVRSNVYFVAFYSASAGALVSMAQDELASGKIDWTRGGINKLMGYAFSMGVAAVVHLYTPQPGTNPNPK